MSELKSKILYFQVPGSTSHEKINILYIDLFGYHGRKSQPARLSLRSRCGHLRRTNDYIDILKLNKVDNVPIVFFQQVQQIVLQTDALRIDPLDRHFYVPRKRLQMKIFNVEARKNGTSEFEFQC